MAGDRHCGGSGGSLAGVVWFGGWLFTMAFAHLVWWKALLGIVIWPFFLGEFIR